MLFTDFMPLLTSHFMSLQQVLENARIYGWSQKNLYQNSGEDKSLSLDRPWQSDVIAAQAFQNQMCTIGKFCTSSPQ